VGAGSTFTVSSNFTQASAGSLTDQIGGTPGSGLFGQVAVTGTAKLAGAFNVALVNGFTPSSGQNFGVMSFASIAGNFTSFGGLNPFFTESLGSTRLDIGDAATQAVDLAATSVTAPTSASVGQSITVNWQATDQSSQATTGSWQDSVYVSPTPTITSSSTLLGMLPEHIILAGGASYQASLTAPLPATLAPGFYYVLVQVDSLYQLPDPNRANNTLAASTGQINIGLPALTLGTPYADSFTAADQDRYYQIVVSAGGWLNVSLQSSASSGAVALYVSQGTPPTLYNYQQAAATPNQPNQTVVVPQVLTSGTYYILAHGVLGAAATAGYTLTVTQTAAVTVSAISPSSGGNAGNVTVEIDGTNFTPAATASLTLGGTTINASAMDFVNASKMFATFNLAGAAVGDYTLSVQQGTQTVTAPSKFQVVSGTSMGSGSAAANSASLSVVLSVPKYIRSGRTGSIVLTYSNATQNDIVAPLLDISSTNTRVFPNQGNGTYLDTDGEQGTPTASGGVYTFTTISGTQYVFLPSGLLNYEQDTNGNRITLGYNGQTKPVTLTYSNPSDPSEPSEQLTLTYNTQGFVSQVADGTGNVWTYTYDAAGHLLSVTAPGPTAAGLTTSYTYDTGSNPETANALLSITSPDRSQNNFTYDSLGRLSGTSANGGTTVITYNYLSEAEVQSTDVAGDVTIVWYNKLGLSVSYRSTRSPARPRQESSTASSTLRARALSVATATFSTPSSPGPV
jgi:YD repeat-containing protein